MGSLSPLRISPHPRTPTPPSPEVVGVPAVLEDPADSSEYRRLLRLLHRGGNGHIRLCRFDGPAREEVEWHQWIRAADLDNPTLPFPSDEIGADTYCSIHSFYRAGTGKQEDLRWLNAVYTDLDARNLPPEELEAGMAALVGTGLLPPVSLHVRSGGGLWCLWLLKGDGPLSIPSTAHQWLQDRHRKIQERLQEVIWKAAPELRPDLGVTDRARMIRLPGSIHGPSGGVVQWHVLDSRAIYTMGELEKVFRVQRPATCANRASRVVPFPAAAKKSGKPAPRWKYELEDLETLREIRGGFREGCRNRAAYYYAYLLRMNGRNQNRIGEAVAKLGEECNPPISASACRWAVESASQIKSFIRRDTFVRDLKVSQEEAAMLQRWGSVQQLHEEADPPRATSRRLRSEERHEAILAEIEDLQGEIPPVRRMEDLLRKNGLIVARKTISRDYKTLGL